MHEHRGWNEVVKGEERNGGSDGAKKRGKREDHGRKGKGEDVSELGSVTVRLG